MDNYNVLNDIAERTGGDIYIGVVGPVRTGKSTFIKNFMDNLVIPQISDAFGKERARDELPQSAQGRTIMTTEPKFIPNEAVTVVTNENSKCKVRLIDCVGYIVDGSLGYIEDDHPRMVSTPWSEEPMDFVRAAEIGTKKVITEHTTIGLVVTTDGSISEIDRASYIDAEKRVISELKEMGKPFVVLLNSVNPGGERAAKLKTVLENEYNVPVMPVSCLDMSKEEMLNILSTILNEFPVKEIGISLPKWLNALSDSHWLKESIITSVKTVTEKINKVSDIRSITADFSKCENIKTAVVTETDSGKGTVKIELSVDDDLFYKIISETTDMEITDDKMLITTLNRLSATKKEYDKISFAINEVKQRGYGIVSPTIDELTLEEPEIVKQGNKFGVRLKASAPSIHMIRADIETVVSPIVGTEKQSEELVHYLLNEFEVDPIKIWQSNIFGKSLHELVNEGLHNKLSKMPEDAQEKLRETLQKIINEGSGGLICIIL